MLKITWLGQGGLLLENEDMKIIIDPYLSDSVEKINPRNYRRVPVCAEFLKVEPDVLICTHNHLDHVDPETLSHYLDTERSICVLSPKSAWDEIRKNGRNHNYVLFNRHSEWTFKGIKFTAVKAEHSDIHPIGVIIDDGDKKYYVTGDTLYNTEIFDDIPNDIDVLFLPINGVGNNMNMLDASRFADHVKAKKVVPVHWGMFDELNPDEFECKIKVIPKIYEEIIL